MAALDQLGFNTTSVAAILAATGLAVGMALQGSLSNFAAGVMIILFRPFKVGDFVQAAGEKGIVEEIHIFHTHLRTPDNVAVIIPNGAVTGGNILNFSTKPTRRIDLIVSCGYQDELRAVKRFLEDLLAGEPRVLTDPEAVVAVAELADNSVNFVVRPWVASADYWPVRWDLTERIKVGFDERGFSIPFPQRELHFTAAAAETAGLSVHASGVGGAAQEKSGALFAQRPAA
jgi:small conductance mechanosensitive channel